MFAKGKTVTQSQMQNGWRRSAQTSILRRRAYPDNERMTAKRTIKRAAKTRATPQTQQTLAIEIIQLSIYKIPHLPQSNASRAVSFLRGYRTSFCTVCIFSR